MELSAFKLFIQLTLRYQKFRIQCMYTVELKYISVKYIKHTSYII